MTLADQQRTNQTDRYEIAVARFAEKSKEEAGLVHESGASRLLTHGRRTPRAYVLLHGTTNSPFQWLEFATILFELGHNVFVPRAPYHGLRSRQVRELARLTAADLQAYAHDALHTGLALGDELILVGISGGSTVAAWAALSRPDSGRTLLAMPFVGLFGLPANLSLPLQKLLGRLPNINLPNPREPRRAWVYRGQSTRGIAAYLSLAIDVLQGTRKGNMPDGQVIIITSGSDRQVNNKSTSLLAEEWRQSGVYVAQYEFPSDMNIAHNPADPAADPVKRELAYQKMLELLGEG
jgi:pimeloyl-ACP methyl ester carboxylesterase